MLSQQDKEAMAECSNDSCTIVHPDQTDRFIRCVLIQKVIDHCEDLEYGLWVSLSDKSFNDYSDNYKNDNHEVTYFGWLSNDIPKYSFEQSIPSTVFTQKGNKRPKIVPNQDFQHPFVEDYYKGITKEEAERRINAMLDSID